MHAVRAGVSVKSARSTVLLHTCSPVLFGMKSKLKLHTHLLYELRVLLPLFGPQVTQLPVHITPAHTRRLPRERPLRTCDTCKSILDLGADKAACKHTGQGSMPAHSCVEQTWTMQAHMPGAHASTHASTHLEELWRSGPQLGHDARRHLLRQPPLALVLRATGHTPLGIHLDEEP